MRLAPLAVAALVPALALAASKTSPAVIEHLLTVNVTAIAAVEADDKLGFAKDAFVVLPGDTGKDAATRSFSDRYTGHSHFPKASQTHKLRKPSISIDDDKGIAYFQGSFDATLNQEIGGIMKVVDRIGGVAVRDGTTWQLAGVMYTAHTTKDDSIIMFATRDVTMPDGEPTIAGDAKLGALVRGWFKSGFASHAATKGLRIASGTAPNEFQTNAGAIKLAKVWDRLGLAVTSIEVRTLAGGAIAFGEAKVVWPKHRARPFEDDATLVPLTLGIVLIPDGDSWRWVSMQYAPQHSSH
jgi:hypothetical protein